MSAIWGCVDLSGKPLPEGICAEMEQPFHSCKIDRFASLTDKNVAMGCALLYIHEESENEPVPIHDRESGIYFTAGAHLFNRDELIAALCPERTDIPDGELLFLAYRTWGRDCVKRIYGNYSYAAYHSRDNELVIGSDHVVSRCIYYTRHRDRIYFSTLVEPMFHGGRKMRLNEKWCAYFLAMTTYAIMVNDIDTPYEEVFRVPAAHYCVLGKNGGRYEKYWDPRDSEPLRLGSDDEYKARFRELFEKCARETLRVRDNVGIRLSSGFDSGAVAAFTSKIFAESGRTLYAYTHVPIERTDGGPELPSEREGVLRLCEMYPNIEPHFMATLGRDGVFSQRKIMGMGFFPVKSTTNIAWIDAISEQMAEDGCRVVLTGQYGNASISRGDMEVYLTTVLARGRVLHFLKTANSYGRHMGYSRKLIFKHILRGMIPLAIRRRKTEDYLKGTVVNRKFAEDVGIGKKDRTLEKSVGLYPTITFEKENRMTYDGISLAHVSDSDAKLSLRYGMQTLDITKDPRIIEFCLSLPMECFSRPGPETRRLTRIYLADLYPPEILPEKAPRGVQSADLMERLIPRWQEVVAEMERVCLSTGVRRMVEEDEVRAVFGDMKLGPEHVSLTKLKNVMYAYSLGVFLESHEWE